VFLEEIRRQYVYTARAKGLPEKQILWKHVFRNAMIPLITGFPAAFIGALLSMLVVLAATGTLRGLLDTRTPPKPEVVEKVKWRTRTVEKVVPVIPCMTCMEKK